MQVPQARRSWWDEVVAINLLSAQEARLKERVATGEFASVEDAARA